MGALSRDLKSGLRALAKRPSVTLIALAVLALGIGANTAMFSVVHAVLLRPLPFPEPQRMVMLWTDNRAQGFPRDITSHPTYRDWRASLPSFEEIAAFSPRSLNLISGGDPAEVKAAAVTAGFFPVLGLEPILGRSFRADEEEPGRHRVTVLSEGLWRRRFGADRAIVGRPIDLGGDRYEVVGVVPGRLDFPAGTELWVPLAPDPPAREARGNYWLYVVGRLKPGATLAAAQAEADTVMDRLAREYPQFVEDMSLDLVPLHRDLVGEVRPALLMLLAAVFLVLLIACANLANLLLARAGDREREFAVRSALGAGGGRIVRQLLVETGLLSLAGGALGVLLAGWGSPLLLRLAARQLPHHATAGISLPVLGVTVAISLLTGLAFGLAPALHLARSRLTDTLREAGRGSAGSVRGRRLRGTLVAAEVALAFVLLVAASLVTGSLLRLSAVDVGIEAERRLTLRLQLPSAQYPDAARVAAFYQELLPRLAALPGVRSAAAGSDVLLSPLPNSSSVAIENRAPDPEVDRLVVTQDSVSPAYFEALGMRLVAGRALEDGDADGALPVAVVNQAMVRRYWPNEEALGKRFKYGGAGSSDVWKTVVGVVADARRSGADQEVMASAYLPMAQAPRRSMLLILVAEREPLALASAVRTEVSRLDPALPLARVAPLEDLLAERLAPRRFQALLLGLFTGLALLLAVVGIYGVVSYLVEQRTREISVRIALGAVPASIHRLVAGQVLAFLVPGLAAGLAGALALTRFLRSQLFEVSPTDPATLGAVLVSLAAAALLAGYLPARRAAQTNSVEALKGD